jgi:hypothetical protein
MLIAAPKLFGMVRLWLRLCAFTGLDCGGKCVVIIFLFWPPLAVRLFGRKCVIELILCLRISELFQGYLLSCLSICFPQASTFLGVPIYCYVTV